MDPGEIEQRYRQYIAALNAGRFDDAAQFYSLRVRYEGQDFDRDQFRDLVLTLGRQVAPDTQNTIDCVLVQGDTLAARLVRTGVAIRDFMGIPPTGRPVSLREHAFYHLADDGCDEVWSVIDLAPLLQPGGSPG